MDLIQSLHNWTSKKLNERLLHQLGGIQICPWCRQTANQGDTWSFAEWERDPMLDLLTCGVCGGTSLWRFELGMMWIAAAHPPPPMWRDHDCYDMINAKLRTWDVQTLRQTIDD